MPDILHRVGVQGSAAKVFEALATLDGLSHWWIVGTTGDPRVGGTLRFSPDGGGFEMKVLEARPGEVVKWQCVGGPREWIGTDLTFRLLQKDDHTFVLFTHAGWRDPVEFMHHCSTKWATFLISLRDALEGTGGRPAPHDLKIHVGD